MGALAGLVAFVALLLVSAVVGYLVSHFLASSVHASGDSAGFTHHALGHSGGALTRYFVFAFNLVPVHLSSSASFGVFRETSGATLVFLPLMGFALVATILFVAGRVTARATKADATTTDRIIQGAVAGTVYALALAAFATASTTHLAIATGWLSASSSVGPNRGEVLLAGLSWGALCCTLGSLSASRSRPALHLLAAAGRFRDWVVGAYAAIVATVACGILLWFGVVVWAGLDVARARNRTAGGTPITKTVPAMVVTLFGANGAALGLLRGMGVPIHEVTSGSGSSSLSLPLWAQLAASVLAIVAMILAGWLTRLGTAHRYSAIGFALRVGVPFGLLSWFAAAAAPLEVTSGHHASGLAVPLLPALGLGFIEAAVAGVAGAAIAVRCPHAFDRVPLLRSFGSKGAPPFDRFVGLPGGSAILWDRWLAVAATALAVMVGAVSVSWHVLDDRYDPASTTLDYLHALSNRDVSALPALVDLPGGYGRLVTPAGLEAMYRAVPPAPMSAIHIISSHVDHDTAAVAAAWTSAGTSESATFALRKAGGSHHYLVFPRWRVVPQLEPVLIRAPATIPVVSVDGIQAVLDAGKSSVTVIAGQHSFSVAATTLTEASSTTQSVSSFNTAVVITPDLTAGGRASAAQTVAAFFQACAGPATTVPPNCPQRERALLGYEQQNETWSIVGDPSGGMAIQSANGAYRASGTWQMALSYIYRDDTGNLVPATAPDQGTFNLKLDAAGLSFVVDSLSSSP